MLAVCGFKMVSMSRVVFLLLVSLAVVHALEHSDVTPTEQIQKAFQEVTTLSNNLQEEVLQINNINAPQRGKKIEVGFSTIILRITEYTARLTGQGFDYNPSPLPDADAKLVVASLTKFVQVHKALLNLVLGKHAVVTLIPSFEPIRNLLVNLEDVVDSFADASSVSSLHRNKLPKPNSSTFHGSSVCSFQLLSHSH